MPKIVDHDQYRKELLGKSFDLFAEKGYASVTMRQIAQALGVSTGTLYHYFPSKEVLFEQLMEDLTQHDILQFATAVKGKRTRAEKILAAFRFLDEKQDYLFKQNLAFADFYQQQSLHPDDPILKRVLARSYEQIEREASKILDIPDPALCLFIFAFVDGLIWQKVHGSKIDFVRQGRLLDDMVTIYLEQHDAAA